MIMRDKLMSFLAVSIMLRETENIEQQFLITRMRSEPSQSDTTTCDDMS